MKYRRFGRTELSMPVFSCGGMRYQQSWQDVDLSEITPDSQRNLEATIHRALEVGINHIETARGYGTSELQLGQLLPRLPREKLIVQTKVSPKANVQEFEQNLERSLANLGLEYVDLLGLHGVNTAEVLDYTLRPGGCLDVVRKFQAQGRVRFIGFSTHGPTEVILQAIRSDQFDYVNLHWYYFNQNNWPAIEAATQHDMGVFIISPSDKGGRLYEPSQRLVDLCAPLSPIVFNDLFCLSHSQVHTLSVGAARPQDFDEHLRAIALLDRAEDYLGETVLRLEDAAIARLTERFGDAEFAEQWYRTWAIGLPRWHETPGQVNIPIMLWLWNLVIAYDMVEFGRARYNLLGNGGHWFPGQRLPEDVQLDFRDCLRSSLHGQHIPELLTEAHRLLSSKAVKRLSQT